MRGEIKTEIKIFMRHGNRRQSSCTPEENELRRCCCAAPGFFPLVLVQCLEVGFGSMGWLADLISWGVPETDLHGIELSTERARPGPGNPPAS